MRGKRVGLHVIALLLLGGAATSGSLAHARFNTLQTKPSFYTLQTTPDVEWTSWLLGATAVLQGVRQTLPLLVAPIHLYHITQGTAADGDAGPSQGAACAIAATSYVWSEYYPYPSAAPSYNPESTWPNSVDQANNNTSQRPAGPSNPIHAAAAGPSNPTRAAAPAAAQWIPAPYSTGYIQPGDPVAATPGIVPGLPVAAYIIPETQPPHPEPEDAGGAPLGMDYARGRAWGRASPDEPNAMPPAPMPAPGTTVHMPQRRSGRHVPPMSGRKHIGRKPGGAKYIGVPPVAVSPSDTTPQPASSLPSSSHPTSAAGRLGEEPSPSHHHTASPPSLVPGDVCCTDPPSSLTPQSPCQSSPSLSSSSSVPTSVAAAETATPGTAVSVVGDGVPPVQPPPAADVFDLTGVPSPVHLPPADQVIDLTGVPSPMLVDLCTPARRLVIDLMDDDDDV